LLTALLNTVLLVGSDLPAYKALFDQVVDMLSEDDQATAKEAYEKALADAHTAHRDAQAI
jgi:hypothetical protein